MLPQIFVGALLLIVALVGEHVKAQNECGPSWRYSPSSQQCYRLFVEPMGWTLAEFRCVFHGGHQIAVHSAADNQFISEMAKQAGPVWLGNAQFGNNPNYQWSDHSPFSFENWKNGVRPPFHKGKKCAKLDGETGKWMQSCCKVPANGFICMRPAISLPSMIIEEPLKPIEEGNKEGSDFKSKLRLA